MLGKQLSRRGGEIGIRVDWDEGVVRLRGMLLSSAKEKSLRKSSVYSGSLMSGGGVVD